jgi:hypothetical protein
MGATTLSITMLSITTFSLKTLSTMIFSITIILIWHSALSITKLCIMAVLFWWMSFMMSVVYAECHKQTHYAECRYAECRYAECCSALFCAWVLKIWCNFSVFISWVTALYLEGITHLKLLGLKLISLSPTLLLSSMSEIYYLPIPISFFRMGWDLKKFSLPFNLIPSW